MSKVSSKAERLVKTLLARHEELVMAGSQPPEDRKDIEAAFKKAKYGLKKHVSDMEQKAGFGITLILG